MVVTRQPRVAAAWTAKPPQPVPISSTWSSGPRSSLSQTRSSLAIDASSSVMPSRVEVGARVHHRRVEHQREQLVAEVVVGGDVAAAAPRRVAHERAADALVRLAQRREPLPRAVERAGVAGGDADHGDDVGRVPQAVDVRLGEPAAAAQQRAPGARRGDVDHRVRRARCRARGGGRPRRSSGCRRASAQSTRRTSARAIIAAALPSRAARPRGRRSAAARAVRSATARKRRRCSLQRGVERAPAVLAALDVHRQRVARPAQRHA